MKERDNLPAPLLLFSPCLFFSSSSYHFSPVLPSRPYWQEEIPPIKKDGSYTLAVKEGTEDLSDPTWLLREAGQVIRFS